MIRNNFISDPHAWLRTPRQQSTRYDTSIQRFEPRRNPWLSFALTATYLAALGVIAWVL